MSIQSNARLEVLKRSTQRISISLPDSVYKRLILHADHEGRSLSNLCAFFLESCAKQLPSEAG
jgi:hypothetical protein